VPEVPEVQLCFQVHEFPRCKQGLAMQTDFTVCLDQREGNTAGGMAVPWTWVGSTCLVVTADGPLGLSASCRNFLAERSEHENAEVPSGGMGLSLTPHCHLSCSLTPVCPRVQGVLIPDSSLNGPRLLPRPAQLFLSPSPPSSPSPPHPADLL
jgi:hypothetical protein